MATTTSISTAEAAEIARRLRALIPSDTISKVSKITTLEFEAGPPSMDAAEWLEAIVGDRRQAVVEHLKYLSQLFEGLAAAIERVASLLTGTDAGNAKALDPLNTWIDAVNAAKTPPLPSGGKTTYDSGDTGGNPQLAWQIGPDGTHVGDPSYIFIDTQPSADDNPDFPNPNIFNDMYNVYKDAGLTTGALPWVSHEVKSTDPED
jgi:hypothetical protein